MRFVIELPVLTLENAALNDVDLSWVSMEHWTPARVKRYHVYRSVAGAAFTLQGYSTGITYNDTASMTIGVTYTWYVVCEYLNGVISGKSNFVQAMISTEYIYASGGNNHIYTIDIRNRLAPVLAGDQDFSAIIDSPNGVQRLIATDSYVFVFGTQSYCFDYLTNKSSLIYKGKAPTGATYVQSGMVRNSVVPVTVHGYTLGFETWTWTDPANPTRAFFSMQSGIAGGVHYDTLTYDPTSKTLWKLHGDGNGVSMRWGMMHMPDDNSLGPYFYDGIQPQPWSALHASSRAVVQKRMPANPNLMWHLLGSGGFVANNLWLVAGEQPVATLQVVDNRIDTDYGQIYIMDDIYLILTFKNVDAPNYGARIYNISDPSAPALVSNLGPAGQEVCDIVIVEDIGRLYAYLIPYANKNVVVVDITDIANPVTLATVNLAGLHTSMNCVSAPKTTRQRTGYNQFLPEVA